MGAASNNRPGLTSGGSTWTKSDNTITLATGSAAAVLTVALMVNYTFAVDLWFCSFIIKELFKNTITLDNNGMGVGCY